MRSTQINLRNMRRSEALSARIRALSEKLGEQHPRILDCHVAVEAAGRHRQKGRQYQVNVSVRIPGRELVANRHEDEDVYVAVRDAFEALARQLEGAAPSARAPRTGH